MAACQCEPHLTKADQNQLEAIKESAASSAAKVSATTTGEGDTQRRILADLVRIRDGRTSSGQRRRRRRRRQIEAFRNLAAMGRHDASSVVASRPPRARPGARRRISMTLDLCPRADRLRRCSAREGQVRHHPRRSARSSVRVRVYVHCHRRRNTRGLPLGAPSPEQDRATSRCRRHHARVRGEIEAAPKSRPRGPDPDRLRGAREQGDPLLRTEFRGSAHRNELTDDTTRRRRPESLRRSGSCPPACRDDEPFDVSHRWEYAQGFASPRIWTGPAARAARRAARRKNLSGSWFMKGRRMVDPDKFLLTANPRAPEAGQELLRDGRVHEAPRRRVEKAAIELVGRRLFAH